MGVLVLGMHRSGTSALTRVLNLLGLDAGRDVLMGPSDSNPTGHWEVERLTDFNDRLLDELGGRWSAPPAVDRASLGAFAEGRWGDEAAELHAEAFAGTPWVWKDPRLSLLLAFWRPVLGRDGAAPPHEVVALRDPTEIAGSLAARDGTGRPYGLALWERYTRTLLADLDGHRSCFVHYERLLAEPEVVARELVAFCDGEPLSDEPERLRAVTDHLDGAHRHQTPAADEVVSPAQAALDEALLEISGVVEAFALPDLPPETPNLQLAFDEAGRLVRHREESERLRAGMDELIAEHQRAAAAMDADLEARSAEASALAEQVMALRAQAEDWERQLVELRARLPVRIYTRLRGLRPRRS